MKNKLGKVIAIFIALAIILTSMTYQVRAVEEGEEQGNETTQGQENTGNELTSTTPEPLIPTNPTEEQTPEQPQEQSDTSNSGSQTAKPTTTATQKKSNNADLSNLGIRPNDFTGFMPSQTTYNVTVPNDVDTVEVYATVKDANATVSGTGNKSLQEGENALMVTVTAQDGTKKTYTINVTRETTEEKEEPVVDENKEEEKGLQKIEIEGVTLSPEFKTDVYEYTAKYIGEGTELNIDAVATDSKYVVEVTGNQELKEGENLITILVTDAEGNNVATYQITVNKSLVDEEAIAREQEEALKKQEKQRKMIAGGIAVALVVIAVIAFVIIRLKRKGMFVEEYSEVPFAGLNDEDYDEMIEEPLEYFDKKKEYIENENIEQEEETIPKIKNKGKRFK